MSFDALTNHGEYLSPYFVEEVLPGEIRKSVAARWAEREKVAATQPDGAGRVTATLVVAEPDPGYGEPSGSGTAALVAPVTASTMAATGLDIGPGLRSLDLTGGAEPAANAELTASVPEEAPRPAVTPREGLRRLRQAYYDRKSDLVALDPENDDAKRAELLHALHDQVLAALGFPPRRHVRPVAHAGAEVRVPLAAELDGVWALECGWATETDAAIDPAGAGRLLEAVDLGPRERVTHGMRLAAHLFAAEEPPRYLLLLAGGVVILADRRTWGEGRYLAVSLDVAFGRNDTRPGGELDVIAALFGADALCPPEAGGAEPLADLVAGSQKQAVGVTAELRDGLRESVELIANEVLARIAEAGVRPEEIDDLKSLGARLTKEALRYLYRILVLLYAEARPELRVLPVDHPEYADGYSLARLGDLVARRLPPSPAARTGTHLFDSLDVLFRVVNDGYRPRDATPAAAIVSGPDAVSPAEVLASGADGLPAVAAQTAADGGADGGRASGERMAAQEAARRRAGRAAAKVSEGEGIRFEPLRSDLFDPEAITLIGLALPRPDTDDDEDGEEPAGAGMPGTIDTRLRNACLYRVLRRLMITKGGRGSRGGGPRRRGGFISYAQLGINQLGAVYEGLMSYTGFIAGEDLYEVAKGGDPKDGSWTVPSSRAGEYPPEVFVHEVDDDGHRTELRRRYLAGSFVYRLSGRDRQTSASYYTPQSLTEVTVQLALKYRIEEAGPDFKARDLLDWTICEPALGSGAFLNEAINQVAAEYLRRRQEEKQKDGTLDRPLDPARYAIELQKAKAYIALHNSYGVDLNATAIELADVSLWLNVMHAGLQAPWFGLHLRRGNSLVGAGRRYYIQDTLADRSWLTSAPVDLPFREGALPGGAIHHFLLPAAGWGAVAAEKEAKELAPDDAKRLAAWRRAIAKAPTTKGTKTRPSQADQLAALARRVEYLWKLVQQRLEISEREIRRQIDVWGADDLPEVHELASRKKIKDDLEAPGTPYWRLKKLMDAWCALWFWPVDAAALLDGTAPDYQRDRVTVTSADPDTPSAATALSGPVPAGVASSWEALTMFAADGKDVDPAVATPAPTTMPANGNARRAPTGGGVARQPERSRRAVALTSLDDWIRFATALIGRGDVAQDSLVSQFSTLDDLEDYEDGLAAWMGQEDWTRLPELFPWLETVDQIAKRQGFFHWEVEFAQVFTRGGFDLQVGNPPWFRPDWKEALVLAEREPWFMLADRPPADEWERRRDVQLAVPEERRSVLADLAATTGDKTILTARSTYPLLNGTRLDLYRAFMCRVWAHSNTCGITGMLHQDTHLSGAREGALRASSYRRLRIHGHFVNTANWAFEANRSIEFGLHVYGPPRGISFLHASRLFGAATLVKSLEHDGEGPLPSQRHNGSWDLRPHRARLVEVDVDRLAEWRRLLYLEDEPIETTPLLYPISDGEQAAISALARYKIRTRSYNPEVDGGYNETTARKNGLIRYRSTTSKMMNDLVIQGPHIGIATPFSKSPRVPCLTRSDWDSVDLTTFPPNPSVRTNFEIADGAARRGASDGAYRLIWRDMIANDTERSLFAAIFPPGVTHVHALQSMALRNSKALALVSGFWAALPLDYVLRITGRSHLQAEGSLAILAPTPDHPLASPLLLRALRLNCLTEAYAQLWDELYDHGWAVSETWAVNWPGVRPIAEVKTEWGWETPLRTERERRAALVEIDALVSVWLRIGADELVAICDSRYPTLVERESEMYFDAKGRRLARDPYAFGIEQTKEDWVEFQEYLEDPKRKLPPAGYVAPFYKADREGEMRAAHAVFSARLQAARDAGWQESDGVGPVQATDAALAGRAVETETAG
ncbi:hypothetical protein [Pseudofrankia sp. BMG5.36]|uniref:hypothetical protein n=1 Tax=Pseudofrankia sp. BMG5.36 TaxID=1834512 RepID=UPI0008DB11E9|nr:hypothetical protein [Pseudofrankia sp. BMG5.36]OHV62896.1 hypothetical protein BCD48_38840 [Pseudofrankia sp. BMG5.36]